MMRRRRSGGAELAEVRAQRVSQLVVRANEDRAVHGSVWQCVLLGQRRGRRYVDDAAQWLRCDQVWFRWHRDAEEELMSMRLDHALDGRGLPPC